MSIRAKDIADKLGLSQPTVSRILSGDLQYRTSNATRKLVIDTAAAMGYQPNALARSLRSKRAGMIGLFVHTSQPGMTECIFSRVYAGVEGAAIRHRVDILVHRPTDPSASRGLGMILGDGRTDGTIVYPSRDMPVLLGLDLKQLPIVALAEPLPGVPSVICDHAAGIVKLLDRLRDAGRRSFAFIAPRVRSELALKSYASFQDCLRARGVPAHERLIIYVDDDCGGQAVSEIAALCSERLAVCCWNDACACNLLEACAVRHIRVPNDVAVVGLGGATADTGHWPLTTVRMPWQEMAERSVDLLMGRIAGREIPLLTTVSADVYLGTTAT